MMISNLPLDNVVTVTDTKGMSKRKGTQHVIDNREIGLTMCGELLPVMAVTDPTPWALGTTSDVATWDDDDYLSTHHACTECSRIYSEITA